MTSSDFLVTMKTKDQILICNMKTTKDFCHINGKLDESLLKNCITKICKEKGVKLISHNVTLSGIDCIVQF